MDGEKIGGTKWLKKSWSKQPEQPTAADKRLAHRHTLALDTEVHFHEQFVNGMFRCRTSNIGLKGVFLPAENMPLTRKSDVELVFHAQSQAKRYCMNAKVVRTSDEGAALKFYPCDEKQIQDFRRFLFKAKVASRQ